MNASNKRQYIIGYILLYLDGDITLLSAIFKRFYSDGSGKVQVCPLTSGYNTNTEAHPEVQKFKINPTKIL